MPIFSLSQTQDLDEVRKFLSTDVNYSAYAIGDLEPPYSESASWLAACSGNEVSAIALEYRALEPHVLFLMGTEPAISALLLSGVGPDHVFFTIAPEIENTFRTFYEINQAYPMFRMRINRGLFKSLDESSTDQVPEHIGRENAQSVEELLSHSAESDGRDMRDVAFVTDMLDSDHYFGIFDQGMLVALAGTHITAPASGMAAVGNVVVHPEYRRRGLGTAVTNSVTRSLVDAGFDLIVLNVRQNNQAAIRTYRKLGYKQMCPFVEGVASRR